VGAPHNSAISFFGQPSARHTTIRARVATVAATSGRFTKTRNSARSLTVSSTPTANTITNHTDVKQTGLRDTSRSD
jgi:hypothetical protein